ncbi:hypothetical protein, partial [Actinotalea sp. C106]|uniref:hypothetical protein n=1 Tax=Actinotalea sp. C106 TaxID=2908644 RepID=UPI0035AC1323
MTSQTDRPAQPVSPTTDHGRLSMPPGWSAAAPSATEVPELTALLRRHELTARGRAAASELDVETAVAGQGREL